MSDVKMSDDNILYLLETLSQFEPEDIECDDFEVAVNDDQFAQMSIVRTAELAKEQIAKLQADNELLREALIDADKWLNIDKDYDQSPLCNKVYEALAATKKDKE